MPTTKQAINTMAQISRCGFVLPLGLTMRLYGGTDKWHHGYTPAYARHFRQRRRKANRVLEIGVGGLRGDYSSLEPGGSLRVWRDYFARSTIVGLDIQPKDVRPLGRRVRFVQGDQTDPATLESAVEALGGAPTIVIDDGSHMGDHVWKTFDQLFPLLPSGSLYVVEDTHTSYWPAYGGSPEAPTRTAVGLAQSLANAVQCADPTFNRRPNLPKPLGRDDVGRIDVWPGVFFVEKR